MMKTEKSEHNYRPLIGVVPLWDEDKNSIWMIPGYMNGIINAGGIPIILPLTDDAEIITRIAERFDGFLFTGGQDVNPKLYGEEPIKKCGNSCNIRDNMEAKLFDEAVIKLDKPVIGICRGIQFINAHLGGTLYQDLPLEHGTAVNHHQSPPYDVPVHTVNVLPDTFLAEIIGEGTVKVNSYHHQAVKSLAGSLKTAAISEDGLIEAVVMPNRRFMVAVQWHPELSLDNPENKKLFKAFVNACI
jgi:putative glutamine amidotransferase